MTTNDFQPPPCRRRRRATASPMAIGYQLLHVTRELPVGAIVVADDFGRTLSHAGDPTLATILAESAMWSAFSDGAVDDLTLARIQWDHPEVEGRHLASSPIDRPDARGARVVAVGDAAGDAVSRVVAGIERICQAANENTGPSFFEQAGPVPTPVRGPIAPTAKDVGVRWVISQTAAR